MTSKAHQKEKHTIKGKLWLKSRLVHQCFIDINFICCTYSTWVEKKVSLAIGSNFLNIRAELDVLMNSGSEMVGVKHASGKIYFGLL